MVAMWSKAHGSSLGLRDLGECSGGVPGGVALSNRRPARMSSWFSYVCRDTCIRYIAIQAHMCMARCLQSAACSKEA